MKSLVDALLYLRKELVIHRDFKPANILLTQDYRIVLLIRIISVYMLIIRTEVGRFRPVDSPSYCKFYCTHLLRIAKLHFTVGSDLEK
jgi:serine/threonine protein kinase